MNDQVLANVGHDSAAEGIANPAAQMITVFDDAGRMIAVPETDIDHYLSLGYSRDYVDPKTVLADLMVMATACTDALKAAVDKVTADGHIDTNDSAELATAEAALAVFVDGGTRVLRALMVRFPTKEPAGVAMTNAEGESTTVDPGQVDLHLEQGWTREGK